MFSDSSDLIQDLVVTQMSPLHRAVCAAMSFVGAKDTGELRSQATLGALLGGADCGVRELARAELFDALARGEAVIAAESKRASLLTALGRKAQLEVYEGRSSRRERVSAAQLGTSVAEGARLFAVAQTSSFAPVASAAGSERLAPWKRLWRWARLEAREIRAVIACAVALGVLSLAMPVAVQAMVNTVAFGGVLQPLIVLSVALFIGLALAGAISILQAYVVEVLQRRFLVRLAEDLGQRLPRVADVARDGLDLRELNNRFFDVITIQKSATELLLVGSSLVLQTGLGLLLLISYHPLLMLFSFVLVLLLVGVILSGRGGTKTAILESKAKFAVAAWLDELARTPQQFAAGPGAVLAADELQLRTRRYVEERKRHYRHVLHVFIGGVFVQVLAIVLLLAVGGYLVMERQLTLGQLVAAEIVVGAIAVGVSKLGKLADKSFDTVAAVDKIGHLIDLPLSTSGSTPLPRRDEAMRLDVRGAQVQRGDSLVPAMPLAFVADKGRSIALHGPSGAGRSSILEALAGQRSLVTGEVRWDDRAQPDADQLASDVLLLRDELLLTGTIEQNLRIAAPWASAAELWDALGHVGLLAVIEKAGGLGARLHDQGRPLSKMQGRQLLLARALLAKPRLLLVDEVLDLDLDDRALVARLHDEFVAADAPWTLVMSSRDADLRARCAEEVTLARVVAASQATDDAPEVF